MMLTLNSVLRHLNVGSGSHTYVATPKGHWKKNLSSTSGESYTRNTMLTIPPRSVMYSLIHLFSHFSFPVKKGKYEDNENPFSI